MNDTIYCYQDTNVLINKLNITDKKELEIAERELTMLRIYDIIDKPLGGELDFNYLKSIHKYIFQDIYSWAGEIRLVDIAKSTMFCKVEFIEEQADVLFDKLRKVGYLTGLSSNEFVEGIAYFFSEINALHPFREGNGRTQREFVRELARREGYLIHFDVISTEEMLEASKQSFLCNYKPMINIFKKAILV